MFTGIIEELGTVETAAPKLRVRCSTVMQDMTEGASIAVNGVMAGCRPEYMPILVALVEANDPAGAEALWRKHLEEANEFLLELPHTMTILDLME